MPKADCVPHLYRAACHTPPVFRPRRVFQSAFLIMAAFLHTSFVFALSVCLMSMKPILQRWAQDGEGNYPVSPEYFTLLAEVTKVVICLTILAGRRMKF